MKRRHAAATTTASPGCPELQHLDLLLDGAHQGHVVNEWITRNVR
jgi:hypothetical protein